MLIKCNKCKIGTFQSWESFQIFYYNYYVEFSLKILNSQDDLKGKYFIALSLTEKPAILDMFQKIRPCCTKIYRRS